jgi:hypothetical protein
MTFAHGFLLVSGVFFLVIFALPLLLATQSWAKAFRWPDAAEAAPLTLYLGRCLGAVAAALTLTSMRYAGSRASQPLLLELIAIAAVILTGVHLWGRLERAQPWTEDVEIIVYGGAAAVAVYARLTL